MPRLRSALARLLELEGQLATTADDAVLQARVATSSWLRFGLGLHEGAGWPGAQAAASLAAAAEDFTGNWSTFWAYRRCLIELQPPGEAPVRFGIDGQTPAPPLPAHSLAVITAWNPNSVPCDESVNRRANHRLAAELKARGARYWAAVNAPDSPFCEESFAVIGVSRDDAFAMAERQGQRAIFYVERNRPFLVARRRGQVVAWEGRWAAG